MNSKPEGAGARACWFVGATYGGTDDQSPLFLLKGIWENGYQDKYLDSVKSIQVGDRIAIKSSYTRKRDLPFDNRGQTVSVMAIKAIGTVIENHGDGRTFKVDWKPFEPPREWFLYQSKHGLARSAGRLDHRCPNWIYVRGKSAGHQPVPQCTLLA